MKKTMFVLALILTGNAYARPIDCPHICSDNKCTFIKDLNGKELADLVLKNETVFNNIHANKPVKFHAMTHGWYNLPSDPYNYLPCRLTNEASLTLLDFSLGNWYLERREIGPSTSLDSNKECKDVATTAPSGSSDTTMYVYGNAQQMANAHILCTKDCGMKLYKTANGEQVVWFEDVGNGTKYDEIYSMEKPFYEGHYLWRFESDQKVMGPFCLYQ